MIVIQIKRFVNEYLQDYTEKRLEFNVFSPAAGKGSISTHAGWSGRKSGSNADICSFSYAEASIAKSVRKRSKQCLVCLLKKAGKRKGDALEREELCPGLCHSISYTIACAYITRVMK